MIPLFLGGEELEKQQKLFNFYRPIELDYKMSPRKKQKHMKEWAQTAFYNLSQVITEDIVKETVKHAKANLRDGVKDFFKKMAEYNIPVVILSGGCGNIIKEVFNQEGILYNNIEFVSNFFRIKDKNAKFNYKTLIYTSNKNYNRIPQKNREVIQQKDKIILLGDTVEDINMVSKELIYKTITIGFLDNNIEKNLPKYKEHFDVVLTNEESFETIYQFLGTPVFGDTYQKQVKIKSQ